MRRGFWVFSQPPVGAPSFRRGKTIVAARAYSFLPRKPVSSSGIFPQFLHSLPQPFHSFSTELFPNQPDLDSLFFAILFLFFREYQDIAFFSSLFLLFSPVFPSQPFSLARDHPFPVKPRPPRPTLTYPYLTYPYLT